MPSNRSKLPLAKRVLNSGKPFNLFHTWTVTERLLHQAISEQKSIDLDVSVDDNGNPYLGHSKEYHEKSGDPYFNSMPIWKAVDLISESNIAAMIDCKHPKSWPFIEEIIAKIGPEKCLVCGFANELKFNYSREKNEPIYLTEWSPIQYFAALKNKYPSVTVTPCANWLPKDLFLSDRHLELISQIRQTLKENNTDTVCLGGVPDDTITNKWLKYFLEENIIVHVVVDKADTSKLSGVYFGETDYLEKASIYSDI